MLVLENITKLYDGSGAGQEAVHGAIDLWLEHGRVRELRPHGTTPPGEGLQRIDLRGATVTPGIVDCHGHITILGLAPQHTARSFGLGQLAYIEKILYASLVDGGVTTMRDVGGATAWMKRLVDEGVLLGPRLKIAICMLSSTGGHADFRGPDRCHADLSQLWPAAPGRPSSLVDGPWECRKRVREIAACGADLIKLCTSPGVASPGDQLEHQDFSPEEIAAICLEAEARGLKVAAHAHSQAGIELAIRNGVHDLQHISFMDPRLVELADQRGCSVTPTSWVTDELTRAEGLSPFVQEKVRKVAEVHRQAVSAAAQGGLRILAGTDPVLPRMHGRNYLEIAHLVRDGLSPLRAWHGATGLAAEEVGQSDAGTLRPGQRADLLVWDADVLADPERCDGALREVIKDGVGYRGALAGLPQRSFHDTVRAMWD